MKKILIVIATLFLINLAFAQEIPILASFTDGTPNPDLSERYLWVTGDRLVSESFTLNSPGTIDKISIFVGKNIKPTNIEIHITKSENGYVVGPDLTTGSAQIGNINDLSASSDYWQEIELTNVNLEVGTYAILIKSINQDGTYDTLLLIPWVNSVLYPYNGKLSFYNQNTGLWKDFSMNIHFKVLGGVEENILFLILIGVGILGIIGGLFYYYKKTKKKRR